MRILLIAAFEDLDQQEDASVLCMRGYDAVTYYDLHSADYEHNGGVTPSDRVVRMQMALELIDGTIPVLHPSAKAPLIKLVAGMCKNFQRPIWRLEDLPALPPSNSEVIDSLNILDSCLCVDEDVPMAVAPLPDRAGSPEPAHRMRKFVARIAVSITENAVSLRERWAVVIQHLLRWERCCNAFLGNSWKNPQTRKLQGGPEKNGVRTYSAKAPLTTT